ncbi:transmembrane protein 164-like [Teleopsis dalmanni]|uniref:transmembrane protein 164-like n=1 Tax=Teleopsis dalmanni TaxID=139649 RepID=UPI0018CCE32A|nr:transmembrane protein 164-like [Teleopsis dalmanni]
MDWSWKWNWNWNWNGSWSWILDGITDAIPRVTGPECINRMSNIQRWTESIFLTIVFIYIILKATKRLNPIFLPHPRILNKPHSAIRLILLILMTFVFGMEMGFKFASKTVIFVMNPCHVQTLIQIYLLAAKPSKVTTALFRIQMNNLNGPFLAILFPEVECRTLPLEQATYWVQHFLLYLIPIYILKSGAHTIEDLSDYNWVAIGVAMMFLYHFLILNALSIYTGINLSHMLCAAVLDPFDGVYYRLAAVIHQTILCSLLNKVTVFLFRSAKSRAQLPPEVYISTGSQHAPDYGLLYHHQKSLSDISLVADYGVAPSDNILTHRQRHAHILPPEALVDHTILLQQEALNMPPSTLTAEYTMPTTKID